MIDSQKINEVVENLVAAMPEGLRTMPQDIRKNFHQTLENSFNQLNLVSRDEFDAQVAVLQRTRLKLEQLEQKIAQLAQSNSSQTSP